MATEREIHRDDAACTCSIEDASECYYHGKAASRRASAYACTNVTCPEQLRGLSDMPGFCSVCHHDLAPMEAGEDVSLYAAKVRELEARVATLTEERDEERGRFTAFMERADETYRETLARAEAAEREAATLREALAEFVEPCLDCGGSGWASEPITNTSSPEPGEQCVACQATGVERGTTEQIGRRPCCFGWGRAVHGGRIIQARDDALGTQAGRWMGRAVYGRRGMMQPNESRTRGDDAVVQVRVRKANLPALEVGVVLGVDVLTMGEITLQLVPGDDGVHDLMVVTNALAMGNAPEPVDAVRVSPETHE